MLISKNWLKEFVNIPDSVSSENLAFDLTMKTVEVEKINNLSGNLENIVVGLVKSVVKHPDADSLQVCQVSADVDNEELFQVVCGGINVKEGMSVAFGKLGAKVRWHGEGDYISLKKAKIRGVESFGMICSSDEIGLGEMFPKKHEKEILDLSSFNPSPPTGGVYPANSRAGQVSSTLVGAPLAEALGLDDVVFDIDNKSMTHRSDLWGHYGIAREVSAFYKEKLKEYEPKKMKKGKELELTVKIEDKELCPRYMAVAMNNIKVMPSPAWMQKRLMSVNVRPINNVVDVTNYVMFELGQPMHAFDAKQIGSTIVVRRAQSAEKFRALDGKDYVLTNDNLVIADEKKAVALAGVMGGENSEIKDDTTSIVLESANFQAVSIRQTSTRLGLRTDSSARFEKSLDSNTAELALKRAVELLLEINPEAYVSSNIVDEFNLVLKKKKIKLPLDVIAKKLGIVIGKKEIIAILEQLGFGVSLRESSILVVTVPSWRAVKDISIAEDLIEEIARLYGYDNIKSSLPSMSIKPPVKNKQVDLERKMRDLLVFEHDFTETYNYSFVSSELIDRIGEDKSKYIELNNPIAKDRPFLRRQIIENMLQNMEMNLHRYEKVKLLEIGRTYLLEDAGEQIEFGSGNKLPKQNSVLGMVYAEKGVNVPFYELSESILRALKRLGYDAKLEKAEIKNKKLIHSGRYAEIHVGGKYIGYIGELHPIAQEAFGIPYRTALLEIQLSLLCTLAARDIDYKPLANFPSVERDIAFTVDKSILHERIVEVIKQTDILIDNVEIFDMYEGKQAGVGKKSLAYHIVYRSDEKTLETKDVDVIQKRVQENLEDKFQAEIRA